MKNFNILRVHRKIRVSGEGVQEIPIHRRDCQKKGDWTIYRFKGGGGLGKKRGGV